jgi:hypothetical protein
LPRFTPENGDAMIKLHSFSLVMGLLFGGFGLLAEETSKMPEMPPPVKEHEWLQKFVGEWESAVEVAMEPGKPPMKCKGTESARMLGGFWIVGEGKGKMEGVPGTMTSLMTLGYDPQKSKYVGTWVDSMNSYLWNYEGTVDATGKVLTLETQGPCPLKPGLVRFKEVTEFKSDDHRVFTSSMQEDDGRWVTMVTASYHRKK